MGDNGIANRGNTFDYVRSRFASAKYEINSPFVVRVDAATLNNSQTLKRGSTGKRVEYLQRNLNGIGCSCGPVDGIYGSTTEATVKRFQFMNGLATDGVAGSRTIKSLYLLFVR